MTRIAEIVRILAMHRDLAGPLQEFIYKMIITRSEKPVDNRLDVAPTPHYPSTRRTALKTGVPRVLAFDPGTSLMGVAVLEGTDLLYYGVKELKRYRPAPRLMRATHAVVNDLIEHYAPTLIA